MSLSATSACLEIPKTGFDLAFSWRRVRVCVVNGCGIEGRRRTGCLLLMFFRSNSVASFWGWSPSQAVVLLWRSCVVGLVRFATCQRCLTLAAHKCKRNDADTNRNNCLNMCERVNAGTLRKESMRSVAAGWRAWFCNCEDIREQTR